MRTVVIAFLSIALFAGACEPTSDATNSELATVDLIFINGRVFTMRWPDPAADGALSADAPHDGEGWHPDAEAIVIDNGKIMFFGGGALPLTFLERRVDDWIAVNNAQLIVA